MSVPKLKLSYEEFRGLVGDICRQITLSGWTPDYVVGITRGGLTPATMISHYFDIPLHTLKVSLRNGKEDTESNLWMPADAFGESDEQYIEDENDVGAVLEAASDLLEKGPSYKNILIVDDINDSGATLNWLMTDWQSSVKPNDPAWEDSIWNNNVRFAVVVDNLASRCRVGMDYVGLEIDKNEKNVWVEFPYETWWK